MPSFFVFLIAFVNNVCTLNYSSCESAIWVGDGKSGVKTRPSEQTVLLVEADLLLVPDSSSKINSETDDQSYSPTEVYAQTWHIYTTHIMHTLPCSAYF